MLQRVDHRDDVEAGRQLGERAGMEPREAGNRRQRVGMQRAQLVTGQAPVRPHLCKSRQQHSVAAPDIENGTDRAEVARRREPVEQDSAAQTRRARGRIKDGLLDSPGLKIGLILAVDRGRLLLPSRVGRFLDSAAGAADGHPSARRHRLTIRSDARKIGIFRQLLEGAGLANSAVSLGECHNMNLPRRNLSGTIARFPLPGFS